MMGHIEDSAQMATGFIGSRQTTLKDEIVISGTGVHSGAPVSLILSPADADTGMKFVISKRGEGKVEITARHDTVCNVTLCTVLGNADGVTVATVEHLLAAIRGLSIDNVTIEIDGAEVPIMDGSSAAFVEAIDEVGVEELDAPRRFIKVLKPVRITEGDAWAELTPHNSFYLDVEIDFDTPLIGRQRMALELNPGVFRSELSRARTFGFMSDVEKLWAAGRALGASLDNTVAIGEDRVINPEGLRFADEFVRHKTLDAVGDLSLAGAPILGAFRSSKGGHKVNSMVLHKLFADEDAWTLVDAPRVRDVQPKETALGVAAANYAPDRS